MPEHINMTLLLMGLGILVFVRAVVLLAFLLIMIKIQGFDFAWLPLIGSALLASILDMIPLVGHFIAVPVLYLCVWKITRSSLYPDAAFTVGLSYALVRCLSLIVAAYIPFGFHPKSQEAKYDLNSLAPDPTNAIAQVNPPAPEDPAPPPPPPEQTDSQFARDISINGVSRAADSAMVTIRAGKKNYILSQGEGTTVSTADGTLAVRFLHADPDSVTLSVNGQPVKYAVK